MQAGEETTGSAHRRPPGHRGARLPACADCFILTSPFGPSPKSLINRFACFLYPHMWCIWSKACLHFLVVVFCCFFYLPLYLSVRFIFYFLFFSFYFFLLLHLRLPWQLLHVWQKAYGEEKGLRALSWQMSRVIMPQRRNEAFGRLPSWGEQRCQFPGLAAALVWHPYMVSQNSSPWRLSIPFRAANRISTHRVVFLFSPPTVPMTSSLLHSAASRVTLGVGFLFFFFLFPLLEKTTTSEHDGLCNVCTPSLLN